MIAACVLLVILQLLPAHALDVRKFDIINNIDIDNINEARSGRSGMTTVYATDKSYWNAKLGAMNKAGVTRYTEDAIEKTRRKDGKFFWADPANPDREQRYSGPSDFMANISWGWHSPWGVYNTIPVGSPLIDDQSNIYIGADDAIRKFDVQGVIKWSYAPRGQLAAAPTLCIGSSRRQAAPVTDHVTEDMLRPDWANGKDAQTFMDFKVGDLVKVKAGASFWADGRELYKAGDQGRISSVARALGEEGEGGKAVIEWLRTGRSSAVQLNSMKSRFVHVTVEAKSSTLPPMLVGSTTAGYVFALDLDSGDELWATWASNEIAGVKGSVACKNGIVVAATNRCTDRYCYRYRNQTNPLTPGNQYVRGLSATDGTALWEYKTYEPVWNMVPLWGPGDSMFFQDWAGRLYSLNYVTGSVLFRVGGDIGTHTQSHAVYDPGHGVVMAMGVRHYQRGRCNPYPAPGILPSCWTWIGTPGFIRGYNASSGRKLWEVGTPEPPSGATTGMVNSPEFHTRLIVTMGYNCWLGATSQIWAIDPDDGVVRWMRDGPTLWTGFCAGDKEGADIRRAMGGREKCHPNSWSDPAIDSSGYVFAGSQVGVLQRWGSANPGPVAAAGQVQVISTLTTGVAFQDAAFAFGNGVMAVSTCTSLIVFRAPNETFPSSGDWTVSHSDYSPIHDQVHGEDISHIISEESHDDITLTPKNDADDIYKIDQPTYDPNIDNTGYGDQQANSQHAQTAYR